MCEIEEFRKREASERVQRERETDAVRRREYRDRLFKIEQDKK